MGWLKDLFKDEPEIIQMHHVPLVTSGVYDAQSWIDAEQKFAEQNNMSITPVTPRWKVKVWEERQSGKDTFGWSGELWHETRYDPEYEYSALHWEAVETIRRYPSEAAVVKELKRRKDNIVARESAKEIELED